MTNSHQIYSSESRRTALVRYAIEFLTLNLSNELSYHTVGHVLEVIAEAKHFAEHDGLSQEQQELISIAAAFHDFGYLYSNLDNEAFAAAQASMMMESYGYDKSQIKTVHQMIMSTRSFSRDGNLCWEPLNYEAKYLLDADLGNFGRKDFFSKLELLAQERKIEDRTKFLRDSYDLLQNHNWFTKAGFALRQQTKLENIAALAKMC